MQTTPLYNKAIDTYYTALQNFGALNVTHEQGIRSAFRSLLDACTQPVGWTLVEEYALPGSRRRPDGTMLDVFQIPRGYWEAKDTKDDLEAEIKKKIDAKYDLSNTIFEDTRRAVLYQNKQRVLEIDLAERTALAGLLTRYFSHSPAEVEEYHKAAAVFADKIPVLAKGLQFIVEQARTDNDAFASAFRDFHEMCRTALNPEIGAGQIEEMLVQHLLTERLFRTVFAQPEFAGRNVIAAEIEKVIAALTSHAFSRAEFLASLDYFYTAIENAARTITDFGEKQGFLNDVYERFFQQFNKKTADTHGIVYTPQPIVDFMCASVEEVLKTQFGKELSDKGVTVLDPCTGTGNFLVNILRRISPLNLKHKYEHELFANEVMLLPYYVASLNIEHAFRELGQSYLPFPGLCFADTLDLAKGQQMSMAFTEKNTERVQREQDAAITVIIGNPPYNVGQANENDNNKNRKYLDLDGRIKETYVKDSKATLRTQLYDAYSRFFRWATDRLGDRDGVICFVTNNGFLEGYSFDGFRKHLAQEYTEIYHLDLGGNARKRGGGSVFNIMVGVGITLLIRRREGMTKPYPPATIHYHALDDKQRGSAKLAELKRAESIKGLAWQTLEPDAKSNWITEGLHKGFADLLPMGTKDAKASKSIDVQAIFKTYSSGVMTGRDSIVYDFNRDTLAARVKKFIDDYNAEIHRWVRAGKPKEIDAFLDYGKFKWSRNLKAELRRERYTEFDASRLRDALYRPFTRQRLYFGDLIVDEHGSWGTFFPTPVQEQENLAIVVSDIGHRAGFSALVTNTIPDRHLLASVDAYQCFPLYTYSLGGVLRRDNITDWALAQFQAQYGTGVTKPDIFHYVYALLHAPAYRERYKENLKRDLPRIPFVGKEPEGRPPRPSPRYGGSATRGNSGEPEGADVFRAFVEAGRTLAALHVGYEQADEYPLKQLVNKDVPFSWRVSKMRLTKDHTGVVVNDSLTLSGIPPEVFQYKLGNRSALEWVLDQYQVSVDKRSGITSDPNRADDPEYIARLVGRVVTVSVETEKCVRGLPPLAPA